ncbi:radical SAM/SPASM domain-containing protein [Halapricum salinum]|uniref:4Fe4S-binding SPASM domain-containing protein n=1 Tax=Halapricum salinum TaxID=1457250 RepID=A0A4D6HBD7_9EURY|nr:SPASM domain-containing protein [Halapricum salinum]QCC51313.1 hypothetical protein DV733_08685 [Halapricum salinum]
MYGHDKDSFTEITGGQARHYDRLTSNLAFLADFLDDPNKIEIGFRTFDNANPLDNIDDLSGELNRLLDPIRQLHDSGVTVSNFEGEYNNWGGVISEHDLSGLDMELADAKTDKDGPCQLIFNKNIILPDGEVNACACRDVDATLSLGHLDDDSLADVLSPTDNTAYDELITRQNEGDFPAVCETCDYYQSVREPDPMHRSQYTLGEFYEKYDPVADDYEPPK